MLTHKSLRIFISALMIASLVLGATTPASARQIHAQGAQSSVLADKTTSMPMDPTDETKVPHYFGPWPNWANSPFTLPNASVEIQGNGTGATAVAYVDPATQGISAIEITSPGSGYTYANVFISGGNNDAVATANVNSSGSVVSVEVTNGGAGYHSPQVAFTGGGEVGPLVSIGNPLVERVNATNFVDPPVAPALVPAFVIVPSVLPDGVLQSFQILNQAAPGGSPAASAGETFRAYVLRPVVADQYEVIFATDTLTVPALTVAGVSEIVNYPVTPTAVQAGDVLAFYGAGIPYDSTAGVDVLSSPVATPPVQGATITLGSAEFPAGTGTYTYSFGAQVIQSLPSTVTPATGVAYGGVDQVTVTDGGLGYTVPTVEFTLPDAPDGIIAKGHVASIALGDTFDGMADGSILPNGVIVDEAGSGYLTAPGVTIHDGTLFDPQVGATLAVATTTLKVTEVALTGFGSGYTTTPTVEFSDANGTPSAAAQAQATVDVGGVTNITVKKPGTGYLTVGMRKFIDDLPGLCTPPDCPSYIADPTAKYIPIAVPETKLYNGIEADEYVIGLVQYRTSFSSDLPPTLVRGYVQLETPANVSISQHYELNNIVTVPDPNNPGQYIETLEPTGYFAVTPPQYLGPVIGATRNKPVRIVFRNLLPNGEGGNLFLPVDASMMGSGMVPMQMDPMPAEPPSVMDMARNPTCTDNPQAQHWDADMGMMMDSCFKNNRATLHLHGGITPWISDGTAHQWITPAGEQASWPQGVSVSEVPDMDVCDAKDDGCQTFYYTNQQSARLLFYHDHSWGITRLNVYAGEAAGYLITDGIEQDLITSGEPGGKYDSLATVGMGTPLIVQDRTFVPDAAQLALQDPTWDTARWGTKGNFWYHHVYMPAQNPGDPGGMSAYGRWMYGPWFWPPAANTKYGPISNPYYDPSCNLDDPSTWQYDTDPFCEPQEIPGTPLISAGMEQFNDTPIVNGVAYPKVTLDPKPYRFRMLNAANDRFFNFQWYVADPTQGNGLTEVALNPAELAAAQTDPVVFPTPIQSAETQGPDWIQIGTEGGFLPAPVVIDGQQPTTWIQDPTVFNVGNVDQHSLLLAPAERADVIVDFSQFAGKTLILYNDAPAAFPARIPSYDYYTGAPDLSPVGAPTILPGYGPNTRTIMQVTIAPSPQTGPAFNLTDLQNEFRHNASGTGVFESDQHPIIVGQAAYNSAYGTSFPASSNCNAPGSTQQRCDGFVRVNDTMSFGFNTLRTPTVKTTIPLQPKAIHDETNSTTFDEYGRMQANLGVEAQPPTPGLQNVTLYPFVNPATEIIDATNLPKMDVNYGPDGRPVDDVKITPLADAGDGTQIWRVTHNGVDTHPIHFHLYDVQVINRVTWDNIISPPEPNELGWKDTVRIAPLEDTIIALRPIIPEVPWELPNAIRPLNPMMQIGSEEMFNNIDPQGNPTVSPIVNQWVNFGWEYVYHCHILSHEEMDMMRPVSVALPPRKPANLNSTLDGDQLTLTWVDDSISETSYVIQRALTPNVWQDIYKIEPELSQTNTKGSTLTYTHTILANTPADYRVVARNTVGYRDDVDPQNPSGFPEVTVEAVSDNVIHVGSTMAPAVLSIARLSSNPSSSPTIDFRVTFSAAVTGVDAADFLPIKQGTFAGTAIDSVSGNGATYTVRVKVGTGTGTLGLDVIDVDDSIQTADQPNLPLGGVGVRNAQNPLPPAPGDGSFSSGLIYTVDYTPPSVASSARLSTNPTSLSAVNFKVTFSEPVTGVDANDFSLTTTGLTGSSIASVTGTGATRTVKVNTGTGTGTIQLNLLDNDTIKDALIVPLAGVGVRDAQNPIPPAPGDGSFYGNQPSQIYTIDRTVPSVSSSIRLDPSPTAHGTVRFNIIFSEPVTGVDAADFTLATTGTIAGAQITGVTSVSTTTYTVSINTGTGSGTIKLNLVDNDSIRDGIGYRLGGTGLGNGNYTTTLAYDINPAPTIVSILRAGTTNPTNAASVDYTVTFSEPVTDVDAADFALSVVTGTLSGTSITGVSPALGPAAVYTVSVNTGSNSGTLRLGLSGTVSIVDGSGNPLAAAQYTNEDYDIDKSSPTVSVARADANPTGAASVQYTVTFSETVTGVDAAAFDLTSTTGASITGVTGSLATYTVTVDTGNGNGTLTLNVKGGTNVADLAGNALTGVPFANGVSYTVEKTPPLVQLITLAGADPTNAASVQYTVTFSEPVTGVDNDPTTGDFALSLNGVSGASITGVSPAQGPAAVYTVTVSTGTGDGTIRLNVVDNDTILNTFNIPLGGAGVAPTPGDGSTTGPVYNIDRTVPNILSIARAGANPTNAASVDYTVTFSEPVTGVQMADFAVSATGSLAGYSITGLNQPNLNQPVYTVTVDTGDGTGQGTLLLDMVASPTIADLAGNTISNQPLNIQETYSIFIILNPGTFDDVNTAWRYTGNWTIVNQPGPYSNTYRYTNVQNAGASLTFNGTQFTVYFAKYSNRGTVEVWIDGGVNGAPQYTFSEYGTALAWQQSWTLPVSLSPGVHTVEFRKAGASTTTYIDIDSISITGPVTPGTYDDTNLNWMYVGNWILAAQTGPYSDTYHYTNVQNAGASLTFNGTQFTVYFARHPNRGTVEVWIDGGVNGAPQYTFSEYGTALAWRQSWTLPVSLSPGVHTVEFRKAGASTTTYIDIDSIVIP